MTPQQALQVVETISKQVPLLFDDNEKLREALEVLTAAIQPSDAE